MRDFTCAALTASLALAASAPAHAEVTQSGANGFHLRIAFETPAPPARAFAALGEIGSWWSPGHTYSGDAANMTLALEAGGCFCESWDGGSVEHGRVVQAQEGALLRMTGGLGPLQALAVTQVHDWTVEAAGEGSKVTYATRVSGDAADNLAALAPLVDMVMSEQVGRLEAHLAAEAP
jgi:hypothetical protein